MGVKNRELRKAAGWWAVACSVPILLSAGLGGCRPATDASDALTARTLAYPHARRDAVRDVLHGITVEDPYRWLERRDSPDVQQWLAAEESLTDTYLRTLRSRDDLAERMKVAWDSGTIEAPYRTADGYFYGKRDGNRQKAAVFFRDAATGAERAVLDPNAWAASDADRSILGFWPSKDGRKLAFATSRNGGDEFRLQVLDVASGAVSDEIDHLYDSDPAWSASGDGFYYRWSPTDPHIPLPELPAHAEIRFHRLGTAAAADVTVRPPTGDPHVTEYPVASRNGHWLFVLTEHGFTRQDVIVRDLRDPGSPWIPLAVGHDAWNEIAAYQDTFFLKTNDGAPRARIYRIDPRNPGRDQWTEVVPERTDAVLDSFRIVAGRLILQWQSGGIAQIQTCDLDGRGRRDIALPGIGSISAIRGEPDDATAYLRFTSYTTAPEIIELDVRNGVERVWQRVTTPIDPGAYVVEQVFYRSKDGTRVPMYIVHRRDVQPGGGAPTILMGYGGFGVSVTPTFRPGLFAWLDRGGVFAEAAIRGGAEYGEDWHRAGMKTHKQNVIDDYVAGAEDLVRTGWTRPDRLVAMGGSNGGLLVGAAITERPDLFAAAIMFVPLLDMVRFPLFGDGEQWTQEYGSPDDPTELRALLEYSPYHNVRRGVRYPAILVCSADSDDRVDPMHARKFVAAMQWASTGKPVLLRVQRNAGHAGADAVNARISELADGYAFALKALGPDR